MKYEHTQRGPLWLMPLGLAVVYAGMGLTSFGAQLRWALLGLAALAAGIALCFRYLTVRDEGPQLAIRFGPLPLFRKLIPYAEIISVNRARSRFIDGWGVHYFIGRGWTYNLWGRDCVEVRTNRQRIRIGSDDAEALAAFLNTKLTP